MPDNTTTHPSAFEATFSPIEEIIEDVRAGKMVIMVDDEDRENEGDLIMGGVSRATRRRELHGDARAWTDLPDALTRALRAAAIAAHGVRRPISDI